VTPAQPHDSEASTLEVSAAKRTAHGVSLRWRIAALTLALLVIFAAILASSVTAVVNTTLQDYQRSLLENDARELQKLYASSQPGSPSPASLGGVRVQVFKPDGTILLGLERGFRVPLETLQAGFKADTYWRPPDQPQWLALLVPVGVFKAKPNAVLLVAADSTYIRTLSERVQATVLATSIALIGLALAGGYLSAQLGLRPLVQVARHARTLNERNLEALEYDGPRDELGVLVETLNRLVSRLKRAFTAQTVFLAEVAHELRTPLTAIEGYIRRASKDPESAPQALADAQRVTQNMTRLVADLLQLSRGEVVQEFVPHVLDWRESLRAVTSEFPGVQLTLPDEPLELLGDPDRLAQLARNLTANAVRAATRPEAVRLEAKRVGNTLELTVSDDGAGIPADVLPRLFEKFVKGKGGGSGLGLAIASQIVAAHQGQITAENQPSGGARFTVRLPALEDEE
jgi:signal transduction histidine kinase